MANLNSKQQRFVNEYLVIWNATQAAIKAGYSTKTAHSTGSRLLKYEGVSKAIDEMLLEGGMKALEALNRLTAIARGSLRHFFRTDAQGRFLFDITNQEARAHLHLVRKLKIRRQRKKGGKGEADWEVELIEIELYSALDALDKIARVHGLYRDSLDVNMSTQVQIIDFSPEEPA